MFWDDHNCDTCININTDLCDNCINGEEPDLEDNYERATPELIAQREAEQLKRVEDSLCQEVMHLVLSQQFIKTFNKCKRFSCNDGSHPKFMPVEARKNSLASTNCHVLCELYCDIPTELQGKNIIKIEEDKVFLTVRESYKKLIILPDNIDSFFRCKDTITKPDFGMITEAFGENMVRMNVMNHSIFLNADYYETTIKHLDNIFALGYTDDTTPVVFLSPSGRVCISPVIVPYNQRPPLSRGGSLTEPGKVRAVK